MQDGFTAFVHEVSEQVHNDIKAKVEAGELPEGATESVATHKTLICMHAVNALRSEGNTNEEINYEAIEHTADRHARAAINA